MAESTATRKRLRSRKGCYTCRASKVKCDEQRLTCGRCRRLQLGCDWEGQAKVKTVKRASKLLPRTVIDEEVCTTFSDTPDSVESDPPLWELIDINIPRSPPLPLQQSPPDFSLSTRITLSEGFEVTSRECHAVQHFQTRFSLARSCKRPPWSTHSLMLVLGVGSPMVMHLIIASSLADLVLHSGEAALTEMADQHYRIGTFLLKQSIQNEGCDHSNVLTCFFLLYVYFAMKDNAATSLSQLSSTTLQYIKTYNLDGQCSLAVSSVISNEQRTFVARMLIWLLYEDIAISFLGHDGKLARYARSNRESIENVYEQSSAIFETCWGSSYPDSEAVDDVENSAVLRFLFEVMRLLEDINQAETAADAVRIEQDMDQLQDKSRAIIRLTNVKDNLSSRLLLNADWTVILFYALRIYHFRKLDGITPNEKVLNAVSAMLLIVQRRLSAGRTEMFRRLEMPLFMAAIETSDPIHREWVASKLTVPRYKRAAAEVLKLQHEWEVRASWVTIQDILRGHPPTPLLSDFSNVEVGGEVIDIAWE